MREKQDFILNIKYESNQAYVILFSLYEDVLKAVDDTGYNTNILDRLNNILKKIKLDNSIVNSFKKLRLKRNVIVHESNNSIRYDKEEIKYMSKCFNEMVLSFDGLRLESYLIDLSIFDDSIKVGISTQKDHPGFSIRGLKKSNIKKDEFYSIYSVIFQLSQKTRLIRNNSFIELCNKESITSVNTYKIYKYFVVYLLMIKNGYMEESTFYVSIDLEDSSEAEIALRMLNYYLGIFSSLLGKNIPSIKMCDSNDCISTIDSNASIYIQNLELNDDLPDFISWNAPKIRYASRGKLEELKILLSDFLTMKDFLSGQLEIISSILDNDGNSLTIMPTGSGKSLIYYFVSLMQPGKTLIISPSKLLIQDQMRNLKDKHNIVNSIEYSSKSNGFSKITFITPENFIREGNINYMMETNADNEMSYLVLDEIHTLSEWSHDFRVEYFMTLNLIKDLFSNTHILGFTATANLKVVENLLLSLNINKNNVFLPTDLINTNFDYLFTKISNLDVEEVGNNEKDRTIIFTNSDQTSYNLHKKFVDLGLRNISLFTLDSNTAYNDFVRGITNTIVASGDIGIGIDIPNVNKIIHYGVPASISQYIQEIGRASRQRDFGKSIVYFKKVKTSKLERLLLQRDLKTEVLIDTLQALPKSSNFRQIHERFIYDVMNPFTSRNSIIDLYQKLKYLYSKSKTILLSNSQTTLRNIYTLYKIGVVKTWKLTNDKISIKVTLRMGFEDYNRLIQTTIDNMQNVGASKNILFNIRISKNFVQIVNRYDDWYLEEYVRYHREQFINLVSFIVDNSENDNERINNTLRRYMSLAMLSSDFSKHTMNELYDLFENDKITQTEIDILLEKNYSYKLDVLGFLAALNKDVFEEDRLNRIISKSSKNSTKEIIKTYLPNIYYSLCIPIKLKIINFLYDDKSIFELLEILYKDNKRDEVYNYLMFKTFNKLIHREE